MIELMVIRKVLFHRENTLECRLLSEHCKTDKYKQRYRELEHMHAELTDLYLSVLFWLM